MLFSFLLPMKNSTLEWIRSSKSYFVFLLLSSIPSPFILLAVIFVGFSLCLRGTLCVSRLKVWKLRVLRYLYFPKGESLICSLSEMFEFVLISVVASPD